MGSSSAFEALPGHGSLRRLGAAATSGLVGSGAAPGDERSLGVGFKAKFRFRVCKVWFGT